MLFMTIFSYEPENRDKVIKRAVSKGLQTPDNVKELGVWSALSGGKVFRLLEADDEKLLYQGTYLWSDLGKIEVVPVMETHQLLEMLASM